MPLMGSRTGWSTGDMSVFGVARRLAAIAAGAVGWTTVTMPPGNDELVCKRGKPLPERDVHALVVS